MITDKYSANLPCYVGSYVYKICPKCNDRHNGTCEHCAWQGTSYGACDVGVRVWSDGSFNTSPLQIVSRKVNRNTLVEVLNMWNWMYFKTEAEAQKALEEYDSIRSIEDRQKRVDAFDAWYKSRRIKNPLCL